MRKLVYAQYLCLLICLNGCSESVSPVVEIQQQDFFGGVGTTRTYETFESWLDPITNAPYVGVPDSLRHRLSVDSALLVTGVCFVYRYTETVNAVVDDFYSSWHLTFPRSVYRQINGTGTSYSLIDELQALATGTTYSPATLAIGDQIYRDTVGAVMTVEPSDLESNCPSVPYLKKSMMVGDSWARSIFISTSTHQMELRTTAHVLELTRVTVPAGTYSAYKLHITTHHFNPDYDIDEGFEYYVPNVGLVLKQSDMVLSQWNSETNTTIVFRQVIKQQLLAVNFIRG